MPFVGKRSDFHVSPSEECAGIIVRTPVVYVDLACNWWIAPRGFVCDGGSVPRILWPLAGHPQDNKSLRAYVLHDRYYGSPDGRSKAEIDRMFYDAMIDDGVGVLAAAAKYRAVQWFGGFAWRRHRRECAQ